MADNLNHNCADNCHELINLDLHTEEENFGEDSEEECDYTALPKMINDYSSLFSKRNQGGPELCINGRLNKSAYAKN
jgi:hypothetical protein